MASVASLQTLVIVLFWLYCPLFTRSEVKPPFEGKITYGFQSSSRCRLLAHESILLETQNGPVLVVDGGLAKFRLDENDSVVDLNAFTITVDLSKSFNLNPAGKFPPLWKPLIQILRDPEAGVPLLSRASLWTDNTQEVIYLQGGHFIETPPWNESQYYLPRADIPGYSIWALNVTTQDSKWKDVTKDYRGATQARRAISGAAISVPQLNKSYYLGGYFGPRAAADNPLNVSFFSDKMITADHKNKSIEVTGFYEESQAGIGYSYGSLHHLPIGKGKGFLLSIMTERMPSDTQIMDKPSVNDERGEEVGFSGTEKHVRLYDLDKREWLVQPTAYLNSQPPPSRKRFCTVLAHNKITNTFDMWVYGGEHWDETGNVTSEGLYDAWVLTMPEFMWIPVFIPDGRLKPTRAHTCHAVGSQLLVVGGWPPGLTVDPEIPCEDQGSIINVFDMSSGSWANSFLADATTYSPLPIVVEKSILNYGNSSAYRKPLASEGWASTELGDAFNYFSASLSGTPTTSVIPPATSIIVPKKGIPPKSHKTVIITTTVIGGIVVIAVIVLVACNLMRPKPIGSPQPPPVEVNGAPRSPVQLDGEPGSPEQTVYSEAPGSEVTPNGSVQPVPIPQGRP